MASQGYCQATVPDMLVRLGKRSHRPSKVRTTTTSHPRWFRGQSWRACASGSLFSTSLTHINSIGGRCGLASEPVVTGGMDGSSKCRVDIVHRHRRDWHSPVSVSTAVLADESRTAGTRRLSVPPHPGAARQLPGGDLDPSNDEILTRIKQRGRQSAYAFTSSNM